MHFDPDDYVRAAGGARRSIRRRHDLHARARARRLERRYRRDNARRHRDFRSDDRRPRSRVVGWFSKGARTPVPAGERHRPRATSTRALSGHVSARLSRDRPRAASRPEQRKRVFDAVADRRIQPECFVEIAMARSNDRCCSPREPAVTERVGVARLFRNRAVEVGDRAVDVAQLEKDDAAVVERVRVVRVQPNRLVVVAHGACRARRSARNALPRLLNASAACGFNRIASS